MGAPTCVRQRDCDASPCSRPRQRKRTSVETFNLSGNLGSLFGPLVPFSGTIHLDFSDDFSGYIASPSRSPFMGAPSSIKLPDRLPSLGQSWRIQQRWRHAFVVVQCTWDVGWL